MHNLIGAGYLALADRQNANHKELLDTLEHQGANFEHHLDKLDSAVARLEETNKSRLIFCRLVNF